MNFFILVSFSVLVTSFISGVIGMAGGMILMGVLSFLLPVVSAMVLHGIIQMHSNGFRAYLLRKHIQWQILPTYILGAAVAFTIFNLISFVPEKSYIFISLGIFGLWSVLFSQKLNLDILKKQNSVLCGFLVVCAQIFAGASGPILDVFYYNSSLKRKEVVATKAITQVLGHLLKIIFYGKILLTQKLEFSIAVIPVALAFVFLGTFLGKQVLNKLSEKAFLKYSKYVILLIALVYLYKGIGLLKVSSVI